MGEQRLITVGLGATIPVDENSRSFIRPEIRIEVDINGDVDKQLKDAKELIPRIWGIEEDQLQDLAMELIGQGKPEFKSSKDMVQELETKINNVRDVLAAHLKSLKTAPASKAEPKKEKKSGVFKEAEEVEGAKEEKSEEAQPAPKKRGRKPGSKSNKTNKENKPEKVDKEEKKKYICGICGKGYDEMEEVFACRKSHEKQSKPGIDIESF